MGMPTFNPTKPWAATSEALTELLDRTYKAKQDAQPRRQYLGASMMGGECLRSVAYQYFGAEKDPDRGFSGQIYRVFDMGHDGETRMAEYLRVAGFHLKTEKADGYQFGYMVAGGKMKGHIDGVILDGPDVGCPWPALWENKALNNKGFNAVQARGIEKEKPLYFAQVQIYMAYMQLERCFFTYTNRDTGQVALEVIEFDAEKAQAISDRGVRVIQARGPEEFPRITNDRSDFRCRFCDYADRCWTTPDKLSDTSMPAPSWLTGGTP